MNYDRRDEKLEPKKVKYVTDPATLLLDAGFLFEINRRILHPHGLALAITVPTEPSETLTIHLWDCREDLEGVDFSDESFKEGSDKYAATLDKAQSRFRARKECLGYVIQGDA